MPATKLDYLVHYICAKCDNPNQLGATKLNKVMWYSDVSAYTQFGSSITGAVYVKRQFGPVPQDMIGARTRLIKARLLIERQTPYHNYQQTQLIALGRPDISMFSSDEISVVDWFMQEICIKHTAASISEMSHDQVWEAAEIGEEIPMNAAAFGGNIGELDEDDIAWARQEIVRIESMSVFVI